MREGSEKQGLQLVSILVVMESAQEAGPGTNPRENR